MSFYNAVLGSDNGTIDVKLLDAVEVPSLDVERLRDVGIDFEEKYIWVLCRTGGGNRSHYKNVVLTESAYYIRDEDDPFDKTYARYFFKVPEDLDLSSFTHMKVPDLEAQTNEAIKKLDSGEIPPQLDSLVNALSAMFGEQKK